MFKAIINIAALIVFSGPLSAQETIELKNPTTESVPPILAEQADKTTHQIQNEIMGKKPKIVVQPTPIQLKSIPPTPPREASDLFISKKNAYLGKKGRKATKLANEWIKKPILPTAGNEPGSVVYTFGASMPIIVCRPLRVSVLVLELGENLIETPRCGDRVQWEITPSESIKNRPPHIFIKALDSGLSTNLIIVTNRRTYIIGLKSRNDKYTPMVSFRYPVNEKRAWEKHLAKQEQATVKKNNNNRFKSGSLTFDAADLDFNYTLDGDAKWKPTRVFNNGVKTYLKMPKIMKFYQAPILLTLNNGEEALVNYRLHDDLFIVDQIFEAAVLISGVGGNQTKVTITHEENEIEDEQQGETIDDNK